MKRIAFCLILVLAQQLLMAQKVYFIYLQSDNRQPFYVKMGTKTYNSNPGGYLILSKLHDSTYHLNVGSSENKFPEQAYTVVLNKKDHGYLVKDFGESGWGLFDLQSLEVIKSEKAGEIKKDNAVKEDNKNVPLFTEILAKAADDPSLKERTVKAVVKTEPVKVEEKKIVEVVKTVEPKVEEKAIVKTEPVKEEEKKMVEEKKMTEVVKTEPKARPDSLPMIKPDTLTIAHTEPVEKKKDIRDSVAQVIAVEYKRSEVIRRSESSTTEGVGLVYTDDQGAAGLDTIRILIPTPKQAFTDKKETVREEKKFLNVDSVDLTAAGKEIKEIKEDKKALSDSVKTVEVKTAIPGCQDKAGQEDFFKLRKNMAAVTSDDEMIGEARQYFQQKCFTVLQVKNLSSLFLNEEGKFQFFKTAQVYISDKENFAQLQAELKEEKYVQQFKSLLESSHQ